MCVPSIPLCIAGAPCTWVSVPKVRVRERFFHNAVYLMKTSRPRTTRWLAGSRFEDTRVGGAMQRITQHHVKITVRRRTHYRFAKLIQRYSYLQYRCLAGEPAERKCNMCLLHLKHVPPPYRRFFSIRLVASIIRCKNIHRPLCAPVPSSTCRSSLFSRRSSSNMGSGCTDSCEYSSLDYLRKTGERMARNLAQPEIRHTALDPSQQPPQPEDRMQF